MFDVFDLWRKKPLLYVRFKRAHSENRPGGSFHESPKACYFKPQQVLRYEPPDPRGPARLLGGGGEA